LVLPPPLYWPPLRLYFSLTFRFSDFFGPRVPFRPLWLFFLPCLTLFWLFPLHLPCPPFPKFICEPFHSFFPFKVELFRKRLFPFFFWGASLFFHQLPPYHFLKFRFFPLPYGHLRLRFGSLFFFPPPSTTLQRLEPFFPFHVLMVSLTVLDRARPLSHVAYASFTSRCYFQAIFFSHLHPPPNFEFDFVTPPLFFFDRPSLPPLRDFLFPCPVSSRVFSFSSDRPLRQSLPSSVLFLPRSGFNLASPLPFPVPPWSFPAPCLWPRFPVINSPTPLDKKGSSYSPREFLLGGSQLCPTLPWSSPFASFLFVTVLPRTYLSTIFPGCTF